MDKKKRQKKKAQHGGIAYYDKFFSCIKNAAAVCVIVIFVFAIILHTIDEVKEGKSVTTVIKGYLTNFLKHTGIVEKEGIPIPNNQLYEINK